MVVILGTIITYLGRGGWEESRPQPVDQWTGTKIYFDLFVTDRSSEQQSLLRLRALLYS